MDIRVKISLAAEGFKQGIGQVVSGFGQTSKAANDAADKYISANKRAEAQTSSSRRSHSQEMVNGELSAIRKVESATIDSAKRIQKTYDQVPNRLPLPLVQQSARSTVKPGADTQGLPALKNTQLEILQLKGKALKLDEEAARVSARAAASQLKAEQNALAYKTRGYAAGKPKGAEETVMNLFGKDYAAAQEKQNAKMAESRLKYISKIEKAESDANAKYLFDMEKRRAANAKIKSDGAKDQAHIAFLNEKGGEFERSMSRTRYALYDVGRRAVAVGMGLAGMFAGAIIQAAKFESAFTSVERTLGLVRTEEGKLAAAGEKVKQSLLELARTTPVSYEDITKVATLGAQMGIATDAIDRFTSTVTKFSAITGVSVEEVSMAFGRLGQLMDVPASKFENLASAISFVGVNAVATDKEILTMAESLAASADQAGFAADEVIGLAGAMASLKVRPEEARGVIVRLFREIDSSVSEGGKRLDDFAKVLGTSSTEAADLWKQDPSKFFSSFLTGAKNAGDLNGTITALGITNSRELNVIQRLANNTDVLASTMADAHEQFILGTYVSQAYADVQDDVASKYMMLQNTIQQVSSAFGDVFLPAAAQVLDILKGLGESILRMPEGLKWVLGMVTALAAGFVIFQGGLALTVAGLLAVRVALAGLGESSIAAMVSIKTLGILMEQIGIKSAIANIGVVKMVTTFNAARAAGLRMSTAILAAAGSLSVLQKALGVIGVLATIATVVWSVVEANNAGSESARKLGDSMIEAGGGASEFADAMAKDTAAAEKGAEVYGTVSGKLDAVTASKQKANKVKLATGEYANEIATGFSKAADETTNYADTAKIAADAQDQFNNTVDTGTSKLEAQTFALGANVAAFTAQALAAYGENKDKNFYTDYLDPKKANLKASAEAVGFNIADMIQAGLSDDTSASEYLDGIQRDVKNINTLIMNDLGQEGFSAGYEKVIRSYGESAGWSAEKIAEVTAAAKENGGVLADSPGFYDDAAKAIDEMKAAAAQAAVEQALLKDTLIATGTSEAAAEDIVSGLNETLRKNAAAAIASNNANSSLAGTISSLIGSVKSGNTEFTSYTEEGRKNLDAWHTYMTNALDAAEALGEGTTGAVSRMVNGLNSIKAAGGDITVPFQELQAFMGNAALTAGFGDLQTEINKATDPAQMEGLIRAWKATKTGTDAASQAARDYADQLLNGLSAASGYAQSFLSGWVADQEALNDTIDDTTEAIVTLGDYANNVGQIISDALTFRFDRNNALADMRTAIEDFNDRTEEARKTVRNLRDEIAGKKETKSDLEAQLALAIKYGDVAGADDIRKELATVNEEIAASQEELSYQNGIATGSMNLNTQAGRDNYAAAQEIIQANADYVQSLINSGASQGTVNKAIADGEAAFRSQMRAMGVSQTKIDELAEAFDDMSTIVRETPNDVNIDANTDPATRALNEFVAKANASKATVKIDVRAPTKEERLKALEVELARVNRLYGIAMARGGTGSEALRNQAVSLKALIDSGNYASGGLIRGKGTATSDSIPINASDGEFMMNAASVRTYGLDFMNAINQQKFGGAMPVSAKVAASGSGPQMVYLSQEDRKLLRAAVDRPVVLYSNNKTIAESANAGNKELARRGKN